MKEITTDKNFIYRSTSINKKLRLIGRIKSGRKITRRFYLVTPDTLHYLTDSLVKKADSLFNKERFKIPFVINKIKSDIVMLISDESELQEKDFDLNINELEHVVIDDNIKFLNVFKSSGNWIFERSSGYAGYRCTKCKTWIYKEEGKKCKCD